MDPHCRPAPSLCSRDAPAHQPQQSRPDRRPRVAGTGLLLKGTRIASGSVIGGKAVVSGKAVPSNTIWAGNPARQIASGVFFHGGCVHNYDREMTEKVQVFSSRVGLLLAARAGRFWAGGAVPGPARGRKRPREGGHPCRRLRFEGQEPLRLHKRAPSPPGKLPARQGQASGGEGLSED